jgi:hypothetical protein
MFSRIRKRFTYANVAMTFALVFAMSGGAYAASKYVISSTKQINPKVLKSLQGKPGTNGAPGPAGPAGPAGQAGSAGEKGAAGTNGTNGSNGANGESVVSSVIAKNAHCASGGAEFKVGGTATYACNGATGPAGPTGPTGPTGSPWTAGGTLPHEATETGEWAVFFTATAAKQLGSSAISFTIPLTAEPEQHFIGNNEELAGEKNEAAAIKEGKCKGEYSKPEAASGNLCVFTSVYQNAEEGVLFGGISADLIGNSAHGDTVVAQSIAAGEVLAVGSWAVTG